MTAIAIAFDPKERRFVIAADGRSATTAPSLEVKTDSAQKIFPARSASANLAYSMTGVVQIGSFDIITNLHQQIAVLMKRKFTDGYAFTGKLCFNMTKVMLKALEDGRIPAIPTSQELPPEEKGRAITFLVFGFFGGKAFWVTSSLYFNNEMRRFDVRHQNHEVSQYLLICTGSEAIRSMIFGNTALDPRLAEYKTNNNCACALTLTTNYIKACSHPAAAEIDPYCRIIGGHIHAAEVTNSAFRWLISPVALR
jgi:hypothetical protein